MLIIDTVSTCFGHLYAHLQEKDHVLTACGVYLLVVLDVAGCGTVITLKVAPLYRNLPHPALPANTLHKQLTRGLSPEDGHKDARNMLRQCQ